MVSETPPFWWKRKSWQAIALFPVSVIYGYFSARRMKKGKRVETELPVLCVGNFTAGGAGKTPTVIALAKAATAMGLTPGLLSRGYGGSLDTTTRVSAHHRARDVGDEPVLLARAAMTVISRNRVDGAKRLKDEGADIIIMDDGFQSARIAYDYALLVIDGRRGTGNGMVIPSGPLRTPLKEQLRHVNALLKVGEGTATDKFVRKIAKAGKPVYEASVQAVDPVSIRGKRVLAFAGIADPEKFYITLEKLGADIVMTRNFADHHYLDDDEIAGLISDAEREGLELITTAKDHARLIGGHGRSEELRQKASVLDIEMAFDDHAAPQRIISATIAAHKKRKPR